MDQQELENIVKQAKKGKQNAQHQIYELFAPRMLGVCLRYAADSAEAEDMMQEGFIKVFTNLKSLKEASQIEWWIRRIMINASLQQLRKNKHQREEMDVDEARNVKVDEEAIGRMAADEILKLVQRLPEGYRAVFSLYAIEGYSHKEIAEKLDIGESTSKSQYFRAKQHLQKMVTELNKVKVEENNE